MRSPEDAAFSSSCTRTGERDFTPAGGDSSRWPDFAEAAARVKSREFLTPVTPCK